jgi:hypothetical protein
MEEEPTKRERTRHSVSKLKVPEPDAPESEFDAEISEKGSLFL